MRSRPESIEDVAEMEAESEVTEDLTEFPSEKVDVAALQQV